MQSGHWKEQVFSSVYPSLLRPVERFVRRVVFCATSISERRALFTASSLGNASATSGLRTTTFDDLRKRLAYFPRTKPPGKKK